MTNKRKTIDMKKIVALCVMSLIMLSSCNKQYTCTCVLTGTTIVKKYTLYNTKKKATKNCNNLNSSTQTCTLEVY